MVWLVLAGFLAVPPFLWHVDLFRTHSPAAIVSLLPAVPVMLAAGAWLTHRLRRPRWELLVLGAAPLLIFAARAPLGTLAAALLLLSSHAIGERVLRDPPPGLAIRLGLRLAAGIGVQMVALFAIGMAGWIGVPALLLLTAPAALSWPGIRREWNCLRNAWTETDDVLHPAVSTILFFALAMGCIGALWAVTPAIAFDPLKMHLASARWYAETGALTPAPLVLESYYPQGAELFMAILWAAGGQAAAQMQSPMLLIPSVLLTIAVLLQCGLSRAAAVCGALAGFSIPYIHWTSFVAKNDIALVLFLLACVAALLARRPVAAAFFLAMAFEVKHVALFGAVALTPIFLHRIWHSPRRLRALAAVVIVFTGLGTFSLVRTWSLTGNPTYPLVRGHATNNAYMERRYTNTPPVLRYAAVPWRIHFDGSLAFESTSRNPIGVWLIVFLPGLACLRRNRRGAALWVILFCFIYYVLWASVLDKVRYFIVPILLLAGLVAPALFRLPRSVAAAAAYGCLLFSFTVCVLLEVTAPQLLWFAGRISAAEYLRQALPPFAAAEALAGRAAADDKILAVDSCASPYAPFAGRTACFSTHDLGRTPEGVAAHARQGGYRFIILPAEPRRGQVRALLGGEEVYQDSKHAAYDLGPPTLKK
jgi:hypothetical protein